MMADENDELSEESELENEKDIPEYKEIFYIDNGSQSNIYCSSILRYPSTTQERFLVGTLKGKVSCLERCESDEEKEKFHGSHDMQAREVSFTYIPGEAEVISMDSYYKHRTINGNKCLMVGVTIIIPKPDGNNLYFFNVYNALEPGSEFDLDKLAVVCQHQSLDFIPYQLNHADIYGNGCYETVFLLAGSDQKIHIFCSDEKQNFEEKTQTEKYFPEFTNIPGLVTWMDVQNCMEFKRFIAIGCINGEMVVSLTDVKKGEVLSAWSLSMDGPISSIRFFTLFNKREEIPDDEEIEFDEKNCITSRIKFAQAEDMNLVVTSCLEISVAFLNVSEKGLDEMVVLKQSDQYDSVTCSCVVDVDFDGNNEILLGTYGQEFLVYKWYASDDGFNENIHFDLVWKKQFSKPLLSIHGLDLMNDGVQELVVISLTGIHILQYEVDQAAEVLLKRLQTIFPTKEHVTQHLKAITEEIDSNDELENVIKALTSTTNNYNEIR